MKQKFTSIVHAVVLGVFLLTVPLTVLQAQSPAPTDKPATTTTTNTEEVTAVAPAAAGEAEKSIGAYLCTPDITLYNCINRLYRFGIVAGFFIAVLMIVVAGYLYMTGGEKGKEKGKSYISSTFVAITILLTSYLLLNQINPELTKFKKIQPLELTSEELGNIDQPNDLPGFDGSNSGSGNTGTGGDTGSGGGNTGSGGTGPYCVPVADAPGVCAHSSGVEVRYPDGDFTNTKPELRIAADKIQEKYPSYKIKQVYRAPEYGAHMRSVFEIKALMSGWTEAEVRSYGQYCQSSGIYYATAADAQDPETRAYATTHFGAHFNSLQSPTTCKSDHGEGIALDVDGEVNQDFAKSIGLCHSVPGFTAHGTRMNLDIPHWALIAYLPQKEASCVRY